MKHGRRRRARAAVVLTLAVWLGGCAAPSPEATAPTDTTSSAAAPVPADTAAAYTVEIDAPGSLRALLEEHLDLARFRSATQADALTRGELDRLIAAAPAQARALLQTEGYFDAQVRVARDADDAAAVRVRVVPGARARIERVDIEVQGDLQTALQAGDADARELLASLRGDWVLPVGKAFRQGAWSDAKSAWLARLRSAGYAAATWSGTSAQVDTADAGVRLLLVAESGPLFRIGELHVEGLERYDERAVRRLAEFRRGDVASEKRLLDFQERLQSAGLFDNATIEFDPDPAGAAATPIRVKVHELSQHQATAGVGISANVGPRVSLEHAFRRPFGLYATARNKIELARDRRAWEGDLTSHPLPDHYRNLLAGKIERLDAADDVRTTWSARAGRSQQTARIERLYFGEIVSSQTVSAVARERGNASSLNYHWLGRRVDDVLLPTRGFTLALQGAGGYAISDFARSGPFGRAWARLNGYVPLGSAWHLESRLEFGQVVATNGVGLPDTVLFRAGGDDSVRGYAYRTLGPLDNGVVTSGRVLMTASLELARPLSLSRPWLWGALFVDAGRAANDWNSIDPAFGYGAGLRWRSPVGPLRMDLAYGQEVRRLRLHISVGVAL